MRGFLFNLTFLVILGIVIFIAFPSITSQVFGVYNGLGILPLFIFAVIIAAIPRRSRRRRHWWQTLDQIQCAMSSLSRVFFSVVECLLWVHFEGGRLMENFLLSPLPPGRLAIPIPANLRLLMVSLSMARGCCRARIFMLYRRSF